MKRTITVKGVGSVSAKPDYITLTLSITEKDMDYEKALEGAARRIAQLEGAAEGAGFEKGALKTLHFNVSTQYEGVRDKDGNYQNVFAGYACLYRLKLAFGLDSKRLAAVLTAVAASGAEPELNISFTVKEPAGVSEALLASAASNAREKAQVLCRASGVELGKLICIDYSWDELNLVSPTRYELADCAMPLMAAGKRCAPEIQPDDIDLHDTAAFVWELEG